MAHPHRAASCSYINGRRQRHTTTKLPQFTGAEVGKAPWGPSAQLLQDMWTRYDGGLRQALGALEDERKRTREQIMELSRVGLGFRLTQQGQ